MKKIIFRITGFGILLIAALALVNQVLSFKSRDGLYSMQKFYEQEEGTVDVLVLGPSLAFADINTAVLWNDHGISSFNLAGSIQPMWNTYYYLKEALKYQRPKVIVLEASLVTMQDDYGDQSRIIKNTFGMRWSRNKVEAIKASAPKEQWGQYLLGYLQYHSRYEELLSEDFQINRGSLQYDNWKGFMCTTDTRPQEANDVRNVAKREELSGKTEDYYRKVIELAKGEEIPLLIVVAPYPTITEWSQACFNTASDIAAEYQVPFINYNLFYQDLDLDYTKDVSDIMHLNYRGNQKITRHLGDYLVSHYDLEDHRGDNAYDSWEQNSRWHLAEIAYQDIVNCMDMEQMFELLKNDDLDIIISVDSEYPESDGNLKVFLSAFSVPSDGTEGIWHISGTNVECIAITREQEQVRQIRYPYHTLTMKAAGGENSIFFDTTQYKTVEQGVNVLVCSKTTGEVVDSFGIAVYGDGIYKAERINK
ncbi:MAG: hypothetical protein HFG65_02350 [Hungatella sp.]|nr:hypothetical protein [Hungatella sp.]